MTSYCFRDYMDERLEEEGLAEAEFERLMEHSVKTSRASYRKNDITRAQAKAAVAKKKTQKAKKQALKSSKKSAKK